jgi:predicted flap endonuclease-1-like 5' DNA nuclease
MSKIIEIEGVGPEYAKKLGAAGIKTVEALLEAGSTTKKREELAAHTGIAGKLILEWVNLADLFRIKGVASEFSDLLDEAGVDTVAELAKRVPENLCVTLAKTNAEKKLVRRIPTMKEVTSWVAQAKTLPRKVEY